MMRTGGGTSSAAHCLGRQRSPAVSGGAHLRKAVILIGFLGLSLVHQHLCVQAFEWSTGGRGLPEVDRQAIAGLWKLTPRDLGPMKEFTVYPKRPPPEQQREVLLMLKEDGSFQQYSTGTNVDDASDDDDDPPAKDLDASWSKFQQSVQREDDKPELVSRLQDDLVKGTWDFVDGKLILAADRQQSEHQTQRPMIEQMRQSKKTKQQQDTNDPDTLLVGRLVVTFEDGLKGNPVIKIEENDKSSPTSSSSHVEGGTTASDPPKESSKTQQSRGDDKVVDAHLSVPKGSVKVGRFFYPKNHPSFFEQPMFQPTRRGAFSLRQVLGTLNAKGGSKDNNDFEEKYRVSDFYNKTFLLTSHPLQPRKPKGDKRWSIKYNKYVEDPPTSSSKQKSEEEAKNRASVPIRVMEVLFHSNNTFSTTGGLGDSTILRGKFDVIGQSKDQLWMQVWRFGFGRSVSGSVYSEGKSLTQDDAKTYWGTIKPEEKAEKKHKEGKHDGDDDETGREATALTSDRPKEENNGRDDGSADEEGRLEVKGSVLVGWGLEPLPVARFIMRETTRQYDDEAALDDNDDDEDEDEDDDDDKMDLAVDVGSADISKIDEAFRNSGEPEDADSRQEDDGPDDFGDAFQ